MQNMAHKTIKLPQEELHEIEKRAKNAGITGHKWITRLIHRELYKVH